MNRTVVLSCAVASLLLAVPREAAAAKLIIYQSGEDVFETGPLPEPLTAQAKLTGVKAGYMCSVFGVFWAYLHIWNCRPVGFQGSTVYTDKALVAAIAAKYPESAMKVGLWAKHGRWAMAGIILLLIIGAVARKKK
jgi:hypothetical protein